MPIIFQVISTKYLPCTNTKPSRIKATHTGGVESVTLSYDHSLDNDENHYEAFRALKDRLGWVGRWHQGNTREGYVFVRENE